jgi:hypothetical protein
MLFKISIWIAEKPPRADESAVCAINRPLRMDGEIVNEHNRLLWKSGAFC